jgi:hypothetical protein
VTSCIECFWRASGRADDNRNNNRDRIICYRGGSRADREREREKIIVRFMKEEELEVVAECVLIVSRSPGSQEYRAEAGSAGRFVL